MNLLIFVFSSLLGFSVLADNNGTNCTIQSAVRCPCDASMIVSCGKKNGYVKNDAKVKSLKVIVTDASGLTREMYLDNPPGGARDFYAADYNQWLREKVKPKSGERMTIAENGLVLDSSSLLYDDPDAKESIGPLTDSSIENSEPCVFVDEEPIVFSSPDACSSKMCSVKVKCNYSTPKKEFISNAVCPANKDGSCPTATECAEDNKILFSKPTNVKNIKIFDSKTSASKQ